MCTIVWVGSTSVNILFAYMVLLTSKWNCQSQVQWVMTDEGLQWRKRCESPGEDRF